MKWILFFFLLIIGFTGLLFWYMQDPGYVQITWLGYEVRLSVIVALLVHLFVVLSFLVSKYILTWIAELPFMYFSFLKKSRESRAKNEMVQMLTSFEAENLNEALTHQKKAASFLEADPFFLWFSGNAFEKASKPLEAEKCFMDLIKNPLTTFLGIKGQIRAAIHRNDLKLAYTLLDKAEKLLPTSPWILKHLLVITRELKDYKKAEELVLRLEDLGYFPPDKSKKQVAYLQYLEALEIGASLSQKEALLRQAHGLDPSLLEAAESLASLLSDKGNKSDALCVIETTWNLMPTPALGNLYIKLSAPHGDVEAYQIANQLVKQKAKSPVGLLFLSHMALKARLWGEAKVHLKELLKINPQIEVYQLLAILELEENQNISAALAWLNKGLGEN
jgi:HemY protein